MALIENVDHNPRLIIDLSAPEGNAFCLLGIAQRYAAQIGLDWPAINADMTSGNYKHLVETFDKHFGDFVDLILPRNWSDYQ